MILHISHICHDNDGHTENALTQLRRFFPYDHLTNTYVHALHITKQSVFLDTRISNVLLVG